MIVTLNKKNYIINVEIRVEWQRRKYQDAGGKLITINF